MAETTPGNDVDVRWRHGLVAVGIGVLGLIVALLLVAWRWRSPNGIAALSAIASPIAAIVGAYFGIQVSAGAAKDSQARADKAEGDKAKALTDVGTVLGHLDPQDASTVRSQLNFQ